MDTPKDANGAKPSKEGAALDKVKEAIEALQLCEGQLTMNGYKELRRRLGHLMDVLFQIGLDLSKST